MEEKYHKLIDKQIEKLSAPDFDLEAWKSSAAHVIGIIFGQEDPKIKELEKLKIDYSSWALRDSGSDYKPIESCKKMGKEIMEIAKDEIELLGVKNQHSALEEKLRSVLTTSQYDKFMAGADENIQHQRSEVLKSLSKDKLIELLNIVL